MYCHILTVIAQFEMSGNAYLVCYVNSGRNWNLSVNIECVYFRYTASNSPTYMSPQSMFTKKSLLTKLFIKLLLWQKVLQRRMKNHQLSTHARFNYFYVFIWFKRDIITAKICMWKDFEPEISRTLPNLSGFLCQFRTD